MVRSLLINSKAIFRSPFAQARLSLMSDAVTFLQQPRFFRVTAGVTAKVAGLGRNFSDVPGQQKSPKVLKPKGFWTSSDFRETLYGGLGRNRTTDTRIFNPLIGQADNGVAHCLRAIRCHRTPLPTPMDGPCPCFSLFVGEPMENFCANVLSLAAVTDPDRSWVAQRLDRAQIAERLARHPQNLGKCLVAQIRARRQFTFEPTVNTVKQCLAQKRGWQGKKSCGGGGRISDEL